jgi:hypothetical protein
MKNKLENNIKKRRDLMGVTINTFAWSSWGNLRKEYSMYWPSFELDNSRLSFILKANLSGPMTDIWVR